MKKIGENIRKFRELKNMTREHIAAELKMSLSNYSKIERDEIDLTISRVQEIANLLEVDTSQILNFDASHIFNVSNNKLEKSVVGKVDHFHFYNEHLEKYIALLEKEIESLKETIKNLSK
jgi:transcriptional regulator with XRE-family HTH domain